MSCMPAHFAFESSSLTWRTWRAIELSKWFHQGSPVASSWWTTARIRTQSKGWWVMVVDPRTNIIWGSRDSLSMHVGVSASSDSHIDSARFYKTKSVARIDNKYIRFWMKHMLERQWSRSWHLFSHKENSHNSHGSSSKWACTHSGGRRWCCKIKFDRADQTLTLQVIDDVDSTFGDGSDASAYTASIASSVYNHVYENGRRYHSYREGSYLAPNDEEEQGQSDVMCWDWTS